MSTITDLAADTSGSSSMGIINTNFDNLNTDKIEATQTVALTNKTIDGDLNTLQDIPYSAIKSTSRSGLDTTLVTGTKGSTDELAKWNVDGDLVSLGKTVTTSAPTIASDDTTIPTSQAVQEAITAQLLTKELYVKYGRTDGTVGVIGDHPIVSLNAAQTINFSFIVPTNFTTLTSIELLMIPDATETLTMTSLNTDIAAESESYNVHSGAATGSPTLAVTTDKITKWRLDNLTGTPYSTISAGDIVGTAIVAGTTLFRVLGLLVKYT